MHTHHPTHTPPYSKSKTCTQKSSNQQLFSTYANFKYPLFQNKLVRLVPHFVGVHDSQIDAETILCCGFDNIVSVLVSLFAISCVLCTSDSEQYRSWKIRLIIFLRHSPATTMTNQTNNKLLQYHTQMLFSKCPSMSS